MNSLVNMIKFNNWQIFVINANAYNKIEVDTVNIAINA